MTGYSHSNLIAGAAGSQNNLHFGDDLRGYQKQKKMELVLSRSPKRGKGTRGGNHARGNASMQGNGAPGGGEASDSSPYDSVILAAIRRAAMKMPALHNVNSNHMKAGLRGASPGMKRRDQQDKRAIVPANSLNTTQRAGPWINPEVEMGAEERCYPQERVDDDGSSTSPSRKSPKKRRGRGSKRHEAPMQGDPRYPSHAGDSSQQLPQSDSQHVAISATPASAFPVYYNLQGKAILDVKTAESHAAASTSSPGKVLLKGATPEVFRPPGEALEEQNPSYAVLLEGGDSRQSHRHAAGASGRVSADVNATANVSSSVDRVDSPDTRRIREGDYSLPGATSSQQNLGAEQQAAKETASKEAATSIQQAAFRQTYKPINTQLLNFNPVPVSSSFGTSAPVPASVAFPAPMVWSASHGMVPISPTKQAPRLPPLKLGAPPAGGDARLSTSTQQVPQAASVQRSLVQQGGGGVSSTEQGIATRASSLIKSNGAGLATPSASRVQLDPIEHPGKGPSSGVTAPSPVVHRMPAGQGHYYHQAPSPEEADYLKQYLRNIEKQIETTQREVEEEARTSGPKGRSKGEQYESQKTASSVAAASTSAPTVPSGGLEKVDEQDENEAAAVDLAAGDQEGDIPGWPSASQSLERLMIERSLALARLASHSVQSRDVPGLASKDQQHATSPSRSVA
ncbi:unnamed protein product, partial [Amoebophrya sp. A25]|eukprot:GSA25T00010501001.1